MRVLSAIFFSVAALTAVLVVATAPNAAYAADSACVKREMAKGNSTCIAKAKCDGVTSRKEQARRCNG